MPRPREGATCTRCAAQSGGSALPGGAGRAGCRGPLCGAERGGASRGGGSHPRLVRGLCADVPSVTTSSSLDSLQFSSLRPSLRVAMWDGDSEAVRTGAGSRGRYLSPIMVMSFFNEVHILGHDAQSSQVLASCLFFHLNFIILVSLKNFKNICVKSFELW